MAEALLPYNEAVQEAERMVHTLRAFQSLTAVLSAANAANNDVIGLTKQAVKLREDVDRLKGEMELLTSAHKSQMEAFSAQISATQQLVADTKAQAAAAASEAAKEHAKLLKKQEAEFVTRGDALRKELADIDKQLGEARWQLADAKAKREEFLRSIGVPA